jgi:hypothetical protein
MNNVRKASAGGQQGLFFSTFLQFILNQIEDFADNSKDE